MPLSESSFIELCSRYMSENEKKVISNLSLVPPRETADTGSSFLNTWYQKERDLRLALAQIRAQKMKKDSFMLPGTCTQDIQQAARTAVGMDSPLSAEQYLYEYRLKLLDEISPIDGFSTDAVYAYGIRLMLVSRMKKFDGEKGVSAYHRIYDSILGQQ
ncbi:MAG: DUF2764 family protein [Treponema sp.]|nr:DUF2764 family protein [Treponema sp.]